MRRRWLVGVAVLLLPLALTAASRLLPRTNGRPVGPKDPATRQTVRLLRKGSTTQRAEAAKLLALLPEKRFVEVVPALVATLADPDPNIRVAVADVLASRLEDIEPLRRPLHEGEALVRREAAVTLGKMGEKATAAIPDLRQACEDPDPRVRVAATLALREVEAAELDRLLSRLHGEPIPEEDVLVGPLLDGLEDEDPVVRCWSASALLELVPNLRRLRWARQRLEGMFEQARSDAPGTILEQIAQGDPEELFFFVRQLRHDLPDVRLRAARSLRSLAREMKDLRALRAREAVQSLVQALDEPGEEFRSDVIQTLARVGPPDATPAIPRLLELVKEGGHSASAAVEALTDLGASGQPVLDALEGALEHPKHRATWHALNALKAFGVDGVPVLVRALEHHDGEVRGWAAQVLGEMGRTAREAVGRLEAHFSDSDERVRFAAVVALRRIAPERWEHLPAVLPSLLHVKDDKITSQARQILEELGPLAWPVRPYPRISVRGSGPLKYVVSSGGPESESFEFLAGIGPAESVPTLRDALKRARGAEQQRVLLALARLGPAARDAAPDLVAHLRSECPPALSRALVEIGPDAVPELAKALRARETRLAALAVLHDLGPQALQAIPAVARLLHDPDDQVRQKAADVLVRVGPPALLQEALSCVPARTAVLAALAREGAERSELVASLQDLLQSPSPETRWAAARALAAMPGVSRPAIPALRHALNDPEVAVRLAAAQALASLEPGAPELLPALRKVITTGPTPFRAQAVALLGLLRDPGEEVLPLVRAALADRDEKVRAAAAGALGARGRDSLPALPNLVRALADPDGEVRAEAAASLGEMGPSARQALPALAVLVRRGGREGLSAARTLGRLGPEARAALPVLIELLYTPRSAGEPPSPRQRIALAKALWQIGGEANPALPPLVGVFREEGPQTVALALDVVGQMGPAAAPAVAAVTGKLFAPCSATRRKAAQVLGSMGPAARPALPHLKYALSDHSAAVRSAAEEAVAKIAR